MRNLILEAVEGGSFIAIRYVIMKHISLFCVFRVMSVTMRVALNRRFIERNCFFLG